MKHLDRDERRLTKGAGLAAFAVAAAMVGSTAQAEEKPQSRYVGFAAESAASFGANTTDDGRTQRKPDTAYETLNRGSHRLRELDLTWTTEAPRGYAFIKQILERRDPLAAPEPPRVVVYLKHEPSGGPPSDWSWYVSDPNDTVLSHDLTIEWYGQASCPDDLTSLQINGPGGLASQNPLTNPIAGYFEYQSASVDRVKDICVHWAEANNCDPTEPGCQLEETFNLYVDVTPEPGDYIELSGSCASGPLPTAHYLPDIELLCTRANF